MGSSGGPVGLGSEVVGGAADAEAALVEDVGVDHRGREFPVAEQFLDGADVVAGFEQVGGEAVAQCVAGGRLGDAGGTDGAADGALDAALVQVVAADDARVRVAPEGGCREEPVPRPLQAGVRVLAREGVRQMDSRPAVPPVGLPESAGVLELPGERRTEVCREHGAAILVALAGSHGQFPAIEIDILHAQPKRFEQAQARAVEQLRCDSWLAGELGEQAADFLAGENDRQALRAACAGRRRKRAGIDSEYLAEEKEQRGEGLVLGRGGNAVGDGEVGEKGRDVGRTEFAWMAQAVEAHEATDPVRVGSLGTGREAATTGLEVQAVQQAGRAGRYGGGVLHTLERRKKRPAISRAGVPAA